MGITQSRGGAAYVSVSGTINRCNAYYKIMVQTGYELMRADYLGDALVINKVGKNAVTG